MSSGAQRSPPSAPAAAEERPSRSPFRAASRFLPILGWLPTYRLGWLRTDFIAGLTIVALLIPEGMAYAQLAGVPPEAAFYAAPVGLLAFAVLGSSRQLVVAVSSAIATMSFATVSLLAEPNTSRFVVLTAALAVLGGAVAVLAGLLKLGRVAQFFSDSVMVGFITGLALIIMVKQLPKVFGVEAGQGNVWERLYDFVVALPTTHLATLLTGLICLALLFALERLLPRIPAALVALVAGIVISLAFGLENRGVEVVGELPSGLAAPQWPGIGAGDWLALLPGALGIALVCFAEAIGPARAFAAAHKYEIDPDQEFIGIGAANVGAGLFQGFPIGASLSKSAANDQAGAHSQMSGIVAAVVTALVALFLTQVFSPLPEATLGAIVIVAVSHMVKLREMRRLYRVRRADFVLAVTALLALMSIEILQALLLAVVVSVFALVYHASKPKLAVLGRAPRSLDFGDVRRHPENQSVPGLLMVRPENGLFFANAAGVKEAVIHELGVRGEPARRVLLDMSPVTDLDAPSAEMLLELHKDLRERGLRLVLIRMSSPVRQVLERADAGREIGAEDIQHAAVEALLDFFIHEASDAHAQEALRLGLLEARDTMQARMSQATPEGRTALAGVQEVIDREIERIGPDTQTGPGG